MCLISTKGPRACRTAEHALRPGRCVSRTPPSGTARKWTGPRPPLPPTPPAAAGSEWFRARLHNRAQQRKQRRDLRCVEGRQRAACSEWPLARPWQTHIALPARLPGPPPPHTPAPISSSPCRPAACVIFAAVCGSAAMLPSRCRSPSSAASISPRPRMSTMGKCCRGGEQAADAGGARGVGQRRWPPRSAGKPL